MQQTNKWWAMSVPLQVASAGTVAMQVGLLMVGFDNNGQHCH
jgi:hypothetical protein